MGSPVPPSETFGRQNEDRQRTRRDVNDALRIDGSQFMRLYEKMQALFAGLTATVTAAVASAMAGTITPGAVNSPGNVTAGGTLAAGGNVTAAGNVTATGNVTASNMTASGQVDSAGSPLKSQPSFNYLVATSYKGAWIDGATYQIGYSPSTEQVKTDLSPIAPSDVDALLTLTPYWGRYRWDDPESPLKVFLLAAEVQAAGFGPDVAPIVENEPLEMATASGPVVDANGDPIVIPVGEAYTVNYSQLTIPLLAALQAEVRRGEERDQKIAALQAALAD